MIDKKAYIYVIGLIFVSIFLFSCSIKKDDINKKVIEVFLNHSYYNLSEDDLNHLTANGIENLKTVDKNFNIVNIGGSRAKRVNRVERGKLFYPFLIKKDSSGYRIIKVFDNSSAWKKGLRTGVLKSINGSDINLKNQYDIEYLLEASDSISINVLGTEGDINLRVKKEILFFPFVWGFVLNEKTGYVRILGFLENSHIQLKNILNNFVQNGVGSVVIDMRGLMAGNYEEAAKVAGCFVKNGSIAYYIKSSKDVYNKTFISDDGSFNELRIIILVDKRTAFLGEAVALSLKENNGAVIIGEKTAGQMEVVRMIDLGCKKMCNLTVAKIYSPSGRYIEGITPDYHLRVDANRETFGINYIIDTDPFFKEIFNLVGN